MFQALLSINMPLINAQHPLPLLISAVLFKIPPSSPSIPIIHNSNIPFHTMSLTYHNPPTLVLQVSNSPTHHSNTPEYTFPYDPPHLPEITVGEGQLSQGVASFVNNRPGENDFSVPTIMGLFCCGSWVEPLIHKRFFRIRSPREQYFVTFPRRSLYSRCALWKVLSRAFRHSIFAYIGTRRRHFVLSCLLWYPEGLWVL